MSKRMSKRWYRSRVIWVNVISIVAEVIQFVIDHRIIPSGLLLIVVNIINIILRKLTHTKLIWK